MALTYGGPVTFTYSTNAPAPTREEQNKKLRNMALDSLAAELDNISTDASRASSELHALSNRASRAASQLRQLRPLLPARDDTSKRKNR